MPVIFQVRSGHFPVRSSTRSLAQWQTIGSGPLASNLAECGGLFQNNTIQIHVTPTHYLTHPKQAEHAFMTIGVSATQPQSMGQIQLTASDARAPLRIDACYLKEPDDLTNHHQRGRTGTASGQGHESIAMGRIRIDSWYAPWHGT